jgi:hypothetical protein
VRADRAHHGGDVGVAFALESAKHGRQPNAERLKPGQELLGVFLGPRRLAGSMKLNRGHAQLMRHFELDPQPSVDAGKNSNRPFFHRWSPI